MLDWALPTAAVLATGPKHSLKTRLEPEVGFGSRFQVYPKGRSLPLVI